MTRITRILLVAALILGVIWSLPALAQAVSPDPVAATVVSAAQSAQGVSWPVAAVLIAWVISRELGRSVTASVDRLATSIRDWDPPSLGLRITQCQQPWDGNERRQSSRGTVPPQ